MPNQSSPHSCVLTVVANRANGPLSEEGVKVAKSLVSGSETEILSEGEAVAISCPAPGEDGPAPATIRAALAPYKLDAIFTKKRGQRKALLICDMDSTTVDGETMDRLCEFTHTQAECAKITNAAMNGEIDFAESLRERTALIKGISEKDLETVLAGLPLSRDVETLVSTMNAKGATTALISGGYTWFTSRLAKKVGFKHNYGNDLEIVNGVVTGKLIGPILGPKGKEEHLQRLCAENRLQLSAALTTGDGANDIPMLQSAGLGIAFYGKPRVREVIPAQVNFTTMRTHLFAQGYKASEFINV